MKDEERGDNAMSDCHMEMDGLNRALVSMGAEPVPIPPSPAELLRRAELARIESEQESAIRPPSPDPTTNHQPPSTDPSPDPATDHHPPSTDLPATDHRPLPTDLPATVHGPPSTDLPATDHRPPSTAVKGTFDELVEVLRCCPAEEMPATVECALEPEADDSEASSEKSERVSTSMGTPRAASWDDEWLDAVEAVETRVGRRICGARLLDGTPCELGSTHRSGRCRFHGGFELTGAPRGNRNAYIHGLYSRRLRTCGDHCPNWESCPMAQEHGGADLAGVPLAKRPVCPYEQAEYNTALADALDLTRMKEWIHPFAVHIAHNMAILQVMVGRAASEMRNGTVAAQTQAVSEKYTFQHEQARPHIGAIARLGAELRKYAEFVSKGPGVDIGWNTYQSRRRWLRGAGCGPEPEEFVYVKPDTSGEDKRRAQRATSRARKALTRAVLAANEGDAAAAVEQWNLAEDADPRFTANWTTALRKSVKAKQRAAARKKPPP